MKKIAVLLLAFAPLLCSAAGKSASATMQVSFTVTEACTVQSKGKSPKVQCTFETPFQVQARPSAAQDTAVAAKAVEGDQVVVYF
jgi:hypothetical protein